MVATLSKGKSAEPLQYLYRFVRLERIHYTARELIIEPFGLVEWQGHMRGGVVFVALLIDLDEFGLWAYFRDFVVSQRAYLPKINLSICQNTEPLLTPLAWEFGGPAGGGGQCAPHFTYTDDSRR